MLHSDEHWEEWRQEQICFREELRRYRIREQEREAEKEVFRLQYELTESISRVWKCPDCGKVNLHGIANSYHCHRHLCDGVVTEEELAERYIATGGNYVPAWKIQEAKWEKEDRENPAQLREFMEKNY